MVDIDRNLAAFLARRSPERRYASFDYCFNYFQQARDDGVTAELACGSQLELSCLHLGFYLASWGMMRGSGGLHRQSLRQLAPVVRVIAAEPPDMWALDVPGYDPVGIGAVPVLGEHIRDAFTVPASRVLVSKTMLGVFGCIPAFDRFFRAGFGGGATLSRGTLTKISDFYQANATVLRAAPIPTLDFSTGRDTHRSYPLAKIIDIVFFEEGLQRAGRARI
jgi:hypothetical protein